MFTVHMDLVAREGVSNDLSTFYRETFRQAIRMQPGFLATQLLAAHSPSEWTHRLLIAFKTQEQFFQWVNSAIHREVSKSLEVSVASVGPAAFFQLVED